MYLAGNLKFLREQIGKTQQELANLFGVEQKTMSSWECGSRTPGIEIIVELARCSVEAQLQENKTRRG